MTSPTPTAGGHDGGRRVARAQSSRCCNPQRSHAALRTDFLDTGAIRLTPGRACAGARRALNCALCVMKQPSPATDSRDRLRRLSIGWACLAGLTAGLCSLPFGLEMAVRSCGCGLFYGLLAFHLERVDSNDSHLRAGLVGAVCGLRSLGMSLPSPLAGADALAVLVVDLLIGWLPLIGSALVLYGTQRMFSASRP